LALKLPVHLTELCTNSEASWEVSYFRDLTDALREALNAQVKLSGQIAAETEVAKIVQDALSYAHRTKTLVMINGTERIGKTKAARKWHFANPDKARLVSLTAGTTDSLFYGEIFDALGCGEKKTGSSSELRSAIKATVQNGDMALVFDEAHQLFGQSEKASIKRLEYIRTEFVNRGIPVVMILTPQFAARLGDLERKTSFNVNQLRGRVSRWVHLPDKLNRKDIECLCRFYLPNVEKSYCDLLTSFALQSEYPAAALDQAIIECREQLTSGKTGDVNEQVIKTAIGFALFTSTQIAATLPTQAPSLRRRRRRGADINLPAIPSCAVPEEQSEPAQRATGMDVATREQSQGTAIAARGQQPRLGALAPDFPESTPSHRAQPALASS
jgi:hypothetical protein